MVTVNGYTQEHMDEVRNDTIVNGSIVDNELVLVKYDLSELNLGTIVGNTVYNRQIANYQLVLSDRGKTIEMDVGVANDLTVPNLATVNFPLGSIIRVIQRGLGTTTIVAGAGVTLRSLGGVFDSMGQNAKIEIERCGTDEWYVSGDLT